MVERKDRVKRSIGGPIGIGKLSRDLGVARPTLLRVISEEESRDPNFEVRLSGGKVDSDTAKRIADLIERAREENRITSNYLHQRRRPTTEF